MTEKSNLILDLEKAYNDHRCSEYHDSLKKALDVLESMLGGEYIKKEDALSIIRDNDGKARMYQLVNHLHTYSIPDIEKIRAEIEEQAYLGINDEYSQGMFETLHIIDNHISGYLNI